MAPSFVHDALEPGLQWHGSGPAFVLLETIARYHILKVDCSADGIFCKAFIERYRAKNENLVNAMSDGVLSRDDILRRRVAPGNEDRDFSVAMSKGSNRIDSGDDMV